MVLNQEVKDVLKVNALNYFDIINRIAFSDDSVAESPASNSLTGEFFRKELAEKIKSEGLFKTNFEGVLGLTEGNDETLNKIGLMLGESNGLILSRVLPVGIAKTSEKEVNVGFELSVSLTDNT
jgi:hypothetical protein